MALGDEEIVQEIYSMIICKGDLVIDIGSHGGRHAIPMAHLVGSRGKIIAFEPLAELAKSLELKFQDLTLSEFEVRSVALSDRIGVANFTRYLKTPEYSGLQRGDALDGERVVESVKVSTLDLELMNNPLISRLSYIKMDAEGAEYLIMHGAKNVIEHQRPCIGFENGDNSSTLYSHSSLDLFLLFERHKYTVIDARGNLMDTKFFVHQSAVQNIWDYIAIPNEKGYLIDLIRSNLSKLYQRIFEISLDNSSLQGSISTTINNDFIDVQVSNQGGWPLVNFHYPSALSAGFDALGIMVEQDNITVKEVRKTFQSCLYPSQTVVFRVLIVDIFSGLKMSKADLMINVVRDGSYWFDKFHWKPAYLSILPTYIDT